MKRFEHTYNLYSMSVSQSLLPDFSMFFCVEFHVEVVCCLPRFCLRVGLSQCVLPSPSPNLITLMSFTWCPINSAPCQIFFIDMVLLLLLSLLCVLTLT